MKASAISRTGLDVEWRRLEIISQNLANMGAAGTSAEAGYKPLRLVSGPARTFAQALAGTPAGAEVYAIEQTAGQPRRIYEPAHPSADAEGFVTYPNLDHASEMALLLQTARVYEANLVAMNAAARMYAKAMEVGRR